jgi:molybdate transport system substrate-binding protein
VRRTIIGLSCLLLVLVGCADDGVGPDGFKDGSNDGSVPPPVELTVFAASSLTEGFTELAADFEALHPGVTVTFNFGPSDGLAAQIGSEGGADVFASASQTWMDDAAATTGVRGRIDFVANELVVITPPDDPAGIATVEDLASDGVQVVLAAEGVPVGEYARELLTNAGIQRAVLANVVTNAEDDAAVVATISSGEADAGIVYVSDVTAEVVPDVRTVSIPECVNVIANYPIAVVRDAEDADLAQAWVDFVTTGPGQSRLVREFGFLPVPDG